MFQAAPVPFSSVRSGKPGPRPVQGSTVLQLLMLVLVLVLGIGGNDLNAQTATRQDPETGKTSRKTPALKITFRDHVEPVFRRRCTGCHGGGQPKADLDLSRYVAVLAGGPRDWC